MKQAILHFFILFLLFNYTDELKANDKCYVHLDKSFYVTGETIWYQLYLPESFKQYSSVIKVDLVNSRAELVESYFIKSDGKLAIPGHLFIPFELVSDIYTLAFTSLLQEGKQKQVLVKIPVPIYNDLTPMPASNKNNSFSISDRPSALSLRIEMESDQSNYSRRSQIEGTIKIFDSKGEAIDAVLSIGVQDWELTSTGIYPDINLHQGKSISTSIPAKLDTSIYLRGQVVDANSQAISSPVLGVYVPKEAQFYYTKTQSDLYFSLKMKSFYDQQTIQFIDFQKGLIQTTLLEHIPEPIDRELQYSKEIETYLELSKRRKKIAQIFPRYDQAQVESLNVLKNKSPTTDLSYTFSDYQNFKDLPSFFREVATPFKFRRNKNGTYYAKIYNASLRKYYQGKPLIIIDGKMTQDTDFLANIPFTAFKEVTILYDPKDLRKRFGALGLNGVASFITYEGSIQLPGKEEASILTIRGIQNTKAYEKTIENTAKHYPILQAQVYWNPMLRTNGAGRTDFSFQHTDDLGTFLITVVARASNGKMGTATIKYKVK